MIFYGTQDVEEFDFGGQCVSVVDTGVAIWSIPTVHCGREKTTHTLHTVILDFISPNTSEEYTFIMKQITVHVTVKCSLTA